MSEEKNNQIKLGVKTINGKMVDLDDEEVDKLDSMSKSLKQVEQNIKENIVSKTK